MHCSFQEEHHLPDAVVDHYDLSDIYVELQGLLLSRNGVEDRCCEEHAVDGLDIDCNQCEQVFNFCDTCSRALSETASKNSSMPQYAIANGLAVGPVPDLPSLSKSERLIVAQAIHFVQVSSATRDPNSLHVMHGNACTTLSDPGKIFQVIATQMPIPSGDLQPHIRVVITSPNVTTAEVQSF